jgi:hypothetical protein
VESALELAYLIDQRRKELEGELKRFYDEDVVQTSIEEKVEQCQVVTCDPSDAFCM